MTDTIDIPQSNDDKSFISSQWINMLLFYIN